MAPARQGEGGGHAAHPASDDADAQGGYNPSNRAVDR